MIVILFNISADASIKIEPSRFIHMIEPGSRITDVIQVTNNTEERLDLTAQYYDWDLDEKENILFTNLYRYKFSYL